MIIKFQDAIPPLTDEEFKQLEKNILADGIRDPLTVWGKVLVDGHNRYRIAQKHNLPYEEKQIDFESEAAAKVWIITNQLGRRNIPSTAIRAMLVLELEPLYAEQAKERMVNSGNQYCPVPSGGTPHGKTRNQLAKIAKVSKSSIDYAKYIKEHAPQEIMRKLENGSMSLRTAYKETAKLFPPKNRENSMETTEQTLTKTDKPAPTITEKTCPTCGRTLPVERFYYSRGRYSYSCIQCALAKKTYGISPTIKEDMQMVEAITNSLTDMDRIIEYTAEDFIATVTASIEDMISVINTEYHHHQDLIKDPINNDGLVKAIAHGANQLGQLIKKIKESARTL